MAHLLHKGCLWPLLGSRGMRLFVSKILMFFVLLLMLIQPVQAKANDLKVDDAYVCMQATAKIEQQYQIKKHLLTTISSVETGRYNEAKKQTLAWPWTINAQAKAVILPPRKKPSERLRNCRRRASKALTSAACRLI